MEPQQKTLIAKNMGRSVDFGDFIIIRPKKNYRLNSNIIIIKDAQDLVVIDAGTPLDPEQKWIIL